MSLEAKICGLKTEIDIAAAVLGGASHIGFIFFEKSPRHIAPKPAGLLRDFIGEQAKVAAVTVNAPDAMLDDIVAQVRPDILQLHGCETPERLAELKARYGLPLMKAFSVRNAEDLDKTRAYEAVADLLLLDAKAPEGSVLPGGNGVSFDWDLLSDFQAEIPVLLSGGINITNLAAAVRLGLDPANTICGIDVSSGVEQKPGIKDAKLITRLLTEFTRLQKNQDA